MHVPDDSNKILTEAEISRASQEVDVSGIHAPTTDELDIGPYAPTAHDVAGEITTDEETELPGTTRPRKGAGRWGRGAPLRPIGKGIPRDFVDGGGLCSPGR